MKRSLSMVIVFLFTNMCLAANAANSVNSFGLDLYRVLSGKEGNIFFSPFSISTALAMTYLGADGNTALQMKQVLHFEDEGLHESFSKLIASLNKPAEGYKLSIANALWVQRNYPLLETFLRDIDSYYRAPVNTVDFVTDLDNSIRKVNDWIEEKTAGKIKNMLTRDDVDSLTRLILTNAIYFKGKWKMPFDEKLTKKDFFYENETTKVEVDMMELTEKFEYYEDDQVQVLKLPYAGSSLSMLIVLPKVSVKLMELEKDLTKEKIEQWLKNLSETRVQLFLPRFKIQQRLSMKETLMKMGMIDPFTDRADFSKIDGTRKLKIQNVIHQAFVEVNEEGTEAAAATAVTMGIKMAMPVMPVIFRADRPFMFFIQEETSNTILFMGRLQKP
ncbi:serpin family protein [Pseudothermotoga sp.]